MIHSLLLAIIFFAVYSANAIPAAPAPSPEDSSTTAESQFVRTSCGTTLYPDLCYHSLSRYSRAVQNDPARLAAVAIDLSLSSAAGTAAFLASLTGRADYGADPRASAALRDCLSVFGDAVDQIRDSLRQMHRLSGTGERLRFQVSNVQTWMSAALTNEDTCTDGFDDVNNSPVKADVYDRAVWVREVTSNALALVNGFVATVTGP